MQGDVNPKKFLGQHFLIDDNISKKIVDNIDFKTQCTTGVPKNHLSVDFKNQ